MLINIVQVISTFKTCNHRAASAKPSIYLIRRRLHCSGMVVVVTRTVKFIFIAAFLRKSYPDYATIFIVEGGRIVIFMRCLDSTHMKVLIITSQLFNYAFSADFQNFTFTTNFLTIVPKQICLFLSPLKFVIIRSENQWGIKLVDLILDCSPSIWSKLRMARRRIREHGAFTFSHSSSFVLITADK